MNIVTVIPLEKGVFQSNLTYFTSQNIKQGDIVHVPLRSKKILALVISASDINTEKRSIKDLDFNLKKINEVKEYSIFPTGYMESVLEINKYYAGRQDYGIVSLIPNIFKEEYDKIAKFKKIQNLSEANTLEYSSKIRTEKLIFQATLADRISAYKTMIRESFAMKKSVFVVLPTEHDIDCFHESLSKGIENFSFTLHGNIKPRKLLVKLEEILSAKHPVLIFGTAPYLATSREDLGLIILEHESSNTYKMIPRPHVDLRNFVELFASKIKAKFVMGDTLLRFETIARKEIDGLYPIQNLSFRVGFDDKFEEKIEIKKRHNPLDDTFLGEKNVAKEKFKVLNEDVISEIRETLGKKKNVFVFALRKGLATQTVCRDCNEILLCENCMAPVVLYLSRDGQKRLFACNRCHREVESESTCKRCGSWNLISLGIGTDTVTEELKSVFADEKNLKILKLDKESAKTTVSAEKIVDEFEKHFPSILVGTEMAFFYLEDKVDLSVIASFDSLWSIPNYKMSEKVIQIITNILAKTERKLLIQTKNEKDPSIMAILNENLLGFVREELEDRKKLGYPPYKRFIKITHLGTKSEAQDTKKALLEIFKEFDPEVFGGFVAKERDKYVTNTLIKIDPHKWSLPELSLGAQLDENLLAKISLLPREFDVFIDPEDLL